MRRVFSFGIADGGLARMIAWAMAVCVCCCAQAGQTIKVPGDAATIQAGVDAAVDGDVVVLTAAAYAGPGNRNVDFKGKAITIESAALDPATCVIDCEGVERGFIFQTGEGAASIVRGVTVINGSAAGAAFPDGAAGGALCAGSSPTIEDCVFVNCSAALGGAIFSFMGHPSLHKTTFAENQSGNGGAVHALLGDVTARDCRFVVNGVDGSQGGAIHAQAGAVDLERCVFIGNRVNDMGEGGAVSVRTGSLRAIDCVFEEGSARLGGAIRAQTADVELVGCTFEKNLGGAGGVMFVDDLSTMSIVSCDFKENGTLNPSGFSCIVNQESELTIEGTTFIGNDSDVMIASLGSNATITDCDFLSNGGEALHVGTATAAIRDCTFIGNGGRSVVSARSETRVAHCVIEGGGGAVFSGDDTLFQMMSCVIRGNSNDDPGGAFRISGESIVEVTGCLIAENEATGVNTGGGGAVYASGTSMTTFSSCTIAGNHAAYRFGVGGGGALMGVGEAMISLENTIVWGNSASPSEGLFVDQIRLDEKASVQAAFCVIEASGGALPGLGNSDADPALTAEFAPGVGSSAIDAGSAALLPVDALDVDWDGDVMEALPVDLAGGSRRVDAVAYVDAGSALDGLAVPDIGAFEADALIEGPASCAADLDGDGEVGASDIAALLSYWGEVDGPGDLNGGGVGAVDLAILLSEWGSCSQ